MKRQKKLSKPALFAMLTGLFTACLIIANLIAGKVIDLGFWGVTITGGIFTFPITFIVNDVLAEVYGYDKIKKVIWLGFGINLLAVAVYTLLNLTATPAYLLETADAYKLVLGTSFRTLVASLSAYLCGSFLNARVMDKMHKRDGEARFGWRAILSTLVGETADAIIFTLLAFAFSVPWEALPAMIISSAMLKTLYEVICLPVTTKVTKWAKTLPEKF